MKLLTYFPSLILALFSMTSLYAHGEDKLGPNGGYMPGAFHTEVMMEKNGSLKVYLLDTNSKNPWTANSNVKASISSNGKTKELSCTKEDNFFKCDGENLTQINNGELQILASRNGFPGVPARYPLPLRLETARH